MISAIIIYATNCDKKLFDMAKKSVDWCDELVLVNGVKGSFNDWHNEGLKRAKNEWILYVDADEEITKESAKEIKEKIRKSNLKYSKELVDKLIEESGRGVTYEQLKTKYGIPLGSLCFLLSKTAKKRSTGQRY